MARETSDFSIQKIVQLLKVRKHMKGRATLFLGARTSGLFRSQSLYTSLQQFSLRDFSQLDGFEKFAECFLMLSRTEEFSETDIDSILTAALQDISANYIDICLAELLKQNIFDLIITTCIDDILEQSLNFIGLREPYDFSTYIPRQDQLAQDQGNHLGRNGTMKIWKVFGDITSRSYNINRRVSHVQEHSNLRNILEGTKTRDMLMVGFDPVWDRDILTTLFPRSAAPNSLWYVNDHLPEQGTQLFLYLENCQAKCISGLEGNHENFFQELHLQMTGKLPAPYQVEQDLHLELRQIRSELASLRREIQQLAFFVQGESGKKNTIENKEGEIR